MYANMNNNNIIIEILRVIVLGTFLLVSLIAWFVIGFSL